MRKTLFLIFIFVFIFLPVFAVEDSVRVELEITDPGSTPPDPAIPPERIPPKTQILPPIIFNLVITDLSHDRAVVLWETDKPSKCELAWGETFDYEKGSISGISFLEKHSTKITELLPETNYYFEIRCAGYHGMERKLKNQFSTLSLPDITPPSNVSDFRAIPGEKEITLRWINPPELDFEGVRIVRSTKFFPLDPWDGKIVYDGMDTFYIDTGLQEGVRYYYTAFSYDKAGNYSSGALVSATPLSIDLPVFPPPPPPEIIPPVEPVPPEIEKLDISDFDFIIRKEKVDLLEGNIIKTENAEPITISIDYEKVPEVLKTIMVTLEKEDTYFSFLLRINNEKTAYEATFLSPLEGGIYPFTASVLDYKNQALKRFYGEFHIEKTKEVILKKETPKSQIILLIIFIIILILVLRKVIISYKKK